jgi:hypothetical protein
MFIIAMMAMDSPARTDPSDSFSCGIILCDMTKNLRKAVTDGLNVRLPAGNIQGVTFCLQLIQLRPEAGQITATPKTFENLQNLRILKKPAPITSRIFLIRPGKVPSMGNKLRREFIEIDRVLMETSRTVTTNRHKLRHFRFANAIGIFSLPGFRPFFCNDGGQHKTGTGTKRQSWRVSTDTVEPGGMKRSPVHRGKTNSRTVQSSSGTRRPGHL